MSISVDFAPEVEKRLIFLAGRRGASLDTYVREIVEKALLADSPDSSELYQRREMQAQINVPTIALLQQWRHEDEATLQTMSPDEQVQDEADVEAFMAALNRAPVH